MFRDETNTWKKSPLVQNSQIFKVKLPIRPTAPPSSRASRMAQNSGASFNSILPPGTIHLSARDEEVISKTCKDLKSYLDYSGSRKQVLLSKVAILMNICSTNDLITSSSKNPDNLVISSLKQEVVYHQFVYAKCRLLFYIFVAKYSLSPSESALK